jgi:hypothetical protein
MSKALYNAAFTTLFVIVFSVGSYAQSVQPLPDQQAAKAKVVILSDETSTVRVANPDELIGVNGHVMRVSEFMALLSANISLAQHPRTLEKQNSSDSQRVAPQPKTRSNSPSSAPAASRAEAPEKP